MLFLDSKLFALVSPVSEWVFAHLADEVLHVRYVPVAGPALPESVWVDVQAVAFLFKDKKCEIVRKKGTAIENDFAAFTPFRLLAPFPVGEGQRLLAVKVPVVVT